MRNDFERIHAGVLFLYFTGILILCGFCYHPLVQILALVGGLGYCGCILVPKDLGKMLLFYTLPAVFVALTNPFFSKEGNTVLFYLNQSPFTKEAFLYGVSMGLSLLCILVWFRVFNTVMTTDRLLYLFGGFFPKTSMLLTVTLRTVPRLRRRVRETREIQQAMGIYKGDQGYVSRLKAEMAVLQGVFASAMEDAIETGDSMRGRGYGNPGRTRLRKNRFDFVQGCILVGLLFVWGVVFAALAAGGIAMQFYPEIQCTWTGVPTICFIISFGFLCFLPIGAELYERIRWKWYRSKI
ncbi:MAG: hypothetical protein IKU26_07490 [Clostridia bacterium]|nr:hypothetical protein [Clostridia bacterium]